MPMHKPMSLCAASLVLALVASASVEAAERTAEQIYQQHCAVCHATGWNDAPVSGDDAVWQSRVADGINAMLERVKTGMNAMPPMGTCGDCTDEELQNVIESMLRS